MNLFARRVGPFAVTTISSLACFFAVAYVLRIPNTCVRDGKKKKTEKKKRKDIIPYVDQMFELLDKTYNQLQTYVPIQDYQIENYKKRFCQG